MSPNKIINRSIATTLVLLALWIATWAGAELLAIAPRHMLNEAANKKTLPTNTDWPTGYKLLKLSSQLKPFNANIQFELGRISWLQASSLQKESEAKSQWLEKSIFHLKKTLETRPTWGRAWAEISTAYLQKRDYLLSYKALVKAMQLEPYEGYSQWMILWNGFALWPMLLPEDTEKFLAIIKHVLEYSEPLRVVDSAIANNRENVITPFFKDDKKMLKYILKKVSERT